MRYPWAVLSLALGLAVVALLLTGSRLGYKTSRLDLLNPNSDYNRLWIEYIEEFGDDDDAVIVVEGESRQQVVPVLEELSAELAREERLFHAVLHEVDLSRIRSKGLHYLRPEELAGLEQFVTSYAPIADGHWTRLRIGPTIAALCERLAWELEHSQGNAPVALHQLQSLAQTLLSGLGPSRRYESPWPNMPQSLATLSDLSSEHLLTKHGRMGFVLLRLAPGHSEFARGSQAVDNLRELIARASARHPQVSIGLTGLPIMENDEMRASQTSMLHASVLSFVGVSLVVIAGFGGIRHALMANLVLLIGMAWAFGYVTLTVGHLNILSVTFTVTLIGIGIDYGTYYVSRYMQLRRQQRTCDEALVETSRTVGPGITTGAITTAIAFFAASLTSFTGVSELGIIAGGGIVLCLIAMLFALPAVLALVDKTRLGEQMPEPVPVHSWIAPLLRIPRLVIGVSILSTVLLAGGLSRLWYDHNLLNMQPEGLESVELERKLLAECDQSVWYALSIADSREELLALKARFLALPSVERTEEIVSLLPADGDAKRADIARIRQRLDALPERPPLIPIDSLDDLGRLLAHAQDLASRTPGGALCAHSLELVRDQMRRQSAADCYADLSQLQQQMAGDLLSRLHALRSISNPEPPQLSDLPASLVNRFVGQTGRHLLKIYGRGDIWNMESLEQFVSEVRQVDPRVTGNPLQAYEASLDMKRSFELAALYALLVIAVVLWIDFRNIWHMLLAMLPLSLGMLQTFGLLGWLGIPLNPANLIALPLIMGIGVDYGVHLVHQFLEVKGRYRIAPSTAVAVMVDALTTIIGFGSLMIASHQGLQSLGRVLTLGIACCTITSLVILPAVFAWMTRHRLDDEDSTASGDGQGIVVLRPELDQRLGQALDETTRRAA